MIHTSENKVRSCLVLVLVRCDGVSEVECKDWDLNRKHLSLSIYLAREPFESLIIATYFLAEVSQHFTRHTNIQYYLHCTNCFGG
jgi:hypothetical protein